MATTIDGEDRVLATAQHIVKSLQGSKAVTDDMLYILSSFDNRLSNISDLINPKPGEEGKPDSLIARFESAEKVILKQESSSAHLWGDDSLLDECSELLLAIDLVLEIMEDSNFKEDEELMDRAEIAVQMAMSKLEDEFRNILVNNTVPFDADRLAGSIRRVSMSFSANEGDILDEFGNFRIDNDDDVESNNHCYHERGRSLGGDISVDLINPDVIPDLKDIASRMIRAGYEKECCQVYSNVRRDVLDDCLGILGVEKLSIEEVQKIEWSSLYEKTKNWIHAVKVLVRALLNGEKRLCEQIFYGPGCDLIKEVCFIETAKGSVMQLLNFGEAVAICRRSSEKLYRILDMYDVLSDALPELQDLFCDESGGFVCSEAKSVLDALGEAAKGTFLEFEKAVQGESSKKAINGGDIHPLARYVMNYVKLLVDYSETLNSLLETDDVTEVSDHNRADEGDNMSEMSPLGRRLLGLIGSLESNLDEKAKLYEDISMQWVFLMNNKQYIVQKVKDPEHPALRKLLGDDWVRRRRGLVRKYATNYLRGSWSKALACLRDEGVGGSSTHASKLALKERFKNFNACFEEIYRVQSAWKVPDPQLRDELRISISEKVLPAYRSFLGRFGSQLEGGRHAGKYIKYTAEDLEGYLADLFEGTPAVLHHMRRKSTS